MALTLLLVTAFAAMFGGLVLKVQAADSMTTGKSIATASDLSSTSSPLRGMVCMMRGGQGFGGRGREPGFGMGNIEVSSEYTQKVNDILSSDADVQGLIAQGYNVTSIRPLIKSVVGADGTIIMKATMVIVRLEKGTSGYATVNVDVENAKVNQIVIITRTVIDKTTS